MTQLLGSRTLRCPLSHYSPDIHSTLVSRQCCLHRPPATRLSRQLRTAEVLSSHTQDRQRSCLVYSYNPNPQKREKTEYGYVVVDPEDPEPVPENDFFEGEQWEILGKLVFLAVPLVIAGAVFVGAYAAATYNSGADTYLATPTSEQDTAKLISAQQQQAPQAEATE